MDSPMDCLKAMHLDLLINLHLAKNSDFLIYLYLMMDLLKDLLKYFHLDFGYLMDWLMGWPKAKHSDCQKYL